MNPTLLHPTHRPLNRVLARILLEKENVVDLQVIKEKLSTTRTITDSNVRMQPPSTSLSSEDADVSDEESQGEISSDRVSSPSPVGDDVD